MAQIRLYGSREHLGEMRDGPSDTVHACGTHRFIGLGPPGFRCPSGRSEGYTITEVGVFESRSVETKKDLIRSLSELLGRGPSLAPPDPETTIFEAPKHNRGIRGVAADGLGANCKVGV